MFSKFVCVSATAPLVQSVLVLNDHQKDSHTLVQQQAKACADCAPSLAGRSDLLKWMDLTNTASDSQETEFCQKIAGIFTSIAKTAPEEYADHIEPQKANPKEEDLSYKEFSEKVASASGQELIDLGDSMKHDADIRSLFMFADQDSKDAQNFFALRRLMLDRAGVNLKNVANINAADLEHGLFGKNSRIIQNMAFQSILIEDGKYTTFKMFNGLKSSHFIELVIMDFYLPYFNAMYSGLNYGDQAAKLFLSLAIKDLLQTLDKVLPTADA
jgi:hypothetical protein